MTVGTFNFMCALMGAEKKEFECSLSSALAKSKGSKDAVDQRASVSPS